MSIAQTTFAGKVQNGVVVLDGGAALPEGTSVTVFVGQSQKVAPPAPDDRMSDEERRRINEIMDRIASLPDENPGDTFTARDHDKALYGEP